MAVDLSNKNIILISPKFFNYEKEIQKELEKKGAHVYYIDDRIENSTINKALFRLKLKEKFGQNSTLQYFKKHLNKNVNIKVDYLIAIVPEGFSKPILEYFKRQLKGTIFILYMWDSMGNRPYIADMLDLYDRKFTFDKSNSEKYGLKFRPLFYTADYERIGLNQKHISSYTYDVTFIGTAHSDRYQVVKSLIKSSKVKVKTFFFFYLQNPLLIIYNLITDPNFRVVKIRDISFKSLTKKEVLNFIENSLCVVDINHPKQTGLTMRTIEVLGAKRKLITTNTDIINYEFYHPDNIQLIDRNNPILNISFLQKPYKQIQNSYYQKYSISQWVDDILV